MKSLHLGLAAATLLCVPYVASANPINVVSYQTLSQTVTFSDVAGGSGNGGVGTNYDGILTSGGQQFAEHFAGQTLGALVIVPDTFDTLSGTPTSPLALQAGLAGNNLAVFDIGGSNGNALAGIGTQGFNFDGVGNGSIAMLFAAPQFQLGFEIIGTDLNLAGAPSGNATVNFFRANGTLIDTVVLANLTDGFYGFSREGGLNDIAGFSVNNTDINGIAYDNITFGTSSTVPEPSTFLLVGMAGLVLARRVRRDAK